MRVRFRVPVLSLLALLVFLLNVYLLVYAGRFHVVDEVSTYAMSESLAKRGSLDTDQIAWTQWARPQREVQGAFGRGGHVYSQKGLATAFLPTALVRLALPHRSIGLTFPAFLANQIFTALTALVLVIYLSSLGYSVCIAIVLGLIYGVATLALPYSRTLFGEPVVAFSIIFSLYALYRDKRARSILWALMGGLGFSLGVWARFVNLPLLLPLWWYQVKSDPSNSRCKLRRLIPKRAEHGVVFLFSSVLLGLGLYFMYNIYRFGSPLKTGYYHLSLEDFSTPPWVGFYGLVFSPFRGIIWFSPLSILSVPGALMLFKRRRDEAVTMIFIVGLYLAIYSVWRMWWGGFMWGPRFLLPVVPILTVLLMPLWESKKWRYALLFGTVVSLVVQFLSVASDFTLTETILQMTFKNPERSQPMYSLMWSPIVLQWKNLRKGFWDIAWVHLGEKALAIYVLIAMSILLSSIAMLFCCKRNHFLSKKPIASFFLVVISFLLWIVAVTKGISSLSIDARNASVDKAMIEAIAHIEHSRLQKASIVTIVPFDYEAFMNWNHTGLYVLGLYAHKPPLHNEEKELLDITQKHNKIIWLLTSRIRPGNRDALPEKLLSKDSFVFYHKWYGDVRLVGFLSYNVVVNEKKQLIQGDFDFSGKIHLRQIMLGFTKKFIAVRTLWIPRSHVDKNYVVFVHLLTREGKYVAGFDGIPGNCYSPTNMWSPGDSIIDQRAILVPSDIPNGEYAIEIGLYDPSTGKRAQVRYNGRVDSKVVVRGVRIAR